MTRPLLALVLLAACGSSAPETMETTATPTPAEPTPAPPVVAAFAPPGIAEAPSEPIVAPHPDPDAVVPHPAPQPLAGGMVTATVCTLDGPPIVGDSELRSIGPIVWASDGSLYLLDHEARVRRYEPEAGLGCTLRLDRSFGDDGRLTLGEGVGSAPESLAADAAGHVLVSTALHGADRLLDGAVELRCEETRGAIALAPSGTIGLAIFGSGPVRRVGFEAGACTVGDWPATDVFDAIESVSFLDETTVLVGGHDGEPASPHLLREHRVDGTPIGPAFGDRGAALGPADHFCRVHQAVRCSHGLCVLDGNCRALRVLDAERHAVGAVDLADVVGLAYPWFPGITEVRDGTAYLTAIQERPGIPRPDVYDTFVVRLDGL